MEVRGSQLERGSLIGGYRIDELISRGGMGVVYRATNIALNRTYALKVLAPELADDEQFRERFKREMRIAAALHHPHIVGIHYAGEQEGLLFFVMDYITGSDLRDLLVNSGPLEPRQAVDLLVQLASALDAAHARGLVHRDVKPANILITVEDGEDHSYLTDFGVAKRSETLSGLTAKGAVVGTVDYMAPEQISGGHIDARTDIYALGCVFFQMLTGKVPYERENSIATLFAHVNDPPPPIQGQLAERYPAFDAVIEKAMATNPDDRYLSAGDFARDATAALQGGRYTGPPKVVATGEATPESEGDLAPAGAMTLPPTTPAPEPESLPPPVVPGPVAPPPIVPEPVAPVSQEPQPPQPEPVAPVSQEPQPLQPEPVAPVNREPEPGPPPTVAPAAMAPSSTAPPSPPPASAPPQPSPPRSSRRYLWPALGLLVIAVAVVAVVALSSGSSKPSGSSGGSKPGKTGLSFASAANPVPTNQVTGNGTATVQLNGNVATVTLNTGGLLNGSPHAMHIHAGGRGICPPASAAHDHNGHLSISTTDGIKYYGPPQVALTSSGDTSPKSIIDFARYPSVGTISYKRTLTVPPGIAAAIRADNAVIVVHGIDYNHNGIYDNVLDRSELNNALPGEATAPALCGPLQGTQTASVTPRRTYVASLYIDARQYRRLLLLCHLLGTTAATRSRPDAALGSAT